MKLNSKGIIGDFLFNGKFHFSNLRYQSESVNVCDLFGDFISQLSFTTLMFLSFIFLSWAAIFSAAVLIDGFTVQMGVYQFYMDIRQGSGPSDTFWMMSMIVGIVVWPIYLFSMVLKLVGPRIKRWWSGVRDSVCFEVEIK